MKKKKERKISINWLEQFPKYTVKWKKQSAKEYATVSVIKKGNKKYTCIYSFVQKKYRKDKWETKVTYNGHKGKGWKEGSTENS